MAGFAIGGVFGVRERNGSVRGDAEGVPRPSTYVSTQTGSGTLTLLWRLSWVVVRLGTGLGRSVVLSSFECTWFRFRKWRRSEMARKRRRKFDATLEAYNSGPEANWEARMASLDSW